MALSSAKSKKVKVVKLDAKEHEQPTDTKHEKPVDKKKSEEPKPENLPAKPVENKKALQPKFDSFKEIEKYRFTKFYLLFLSIYFSLEAGNMIYVDNLNGITKEQLYEKFKPVFYFNLSIFFILFIVWSHCGNSNETRNGNWFTLRVNRILQYRINYLVPCYFINFLRKGTYKKSTPNPVIIHSKNPTLQTDQTHLEFLKHKR